jgi:hypothetical protein
LYDCTAQQNWLQQQQCDPCGRDLLLADVFNALEEELLNLRLFQPGDESSLLRDEVHEGWFFFLMAAMLLAAQLMV